MKVNGRNILHFEIFLICIPSNSQVYLGYTVFVELKYNIYEKLLNLMKFHKALAFIKIIQVEKCTIQLEFTLWINVHRHFYWVNVVFIEFCASHTKRSW